MSSEPSTVFSGSASTLVSGDLVVREVVRRGVAALRDRLVVETLDQLEVRTRLRQLQGDAEERRRILVDLQPLPRRDVGRLGVEVVTDEPELDRRLGEEQRELHDALRPAIVSKLALIVAETL